MEYNNFKKLVEEMNSEGFNNVSFVLGGYNDVHSFAMKYNIELLEHQKKCILNCSDNFITFGTIIIFNIKFCNFIFI